MTAIRTTALVAAAFLLAVVAVQAAPCIECKDPLCNTQNCKNTCKQSCQPTFNSAACTTFGTGKGKDIGKQACTTTQKYCSGSNPPRAPAPRSFPATLSQCRTLALDTCKSQAYTTAMGAGGPCARAINGYMECKRAEFSDFFNGEVNELCKTAALQIE